MINPFKKTHWITNFPKHYPFYKKVFANSIYFLTGIIVHARKNLLTHKDLIKVRVKLRKGDIVLLGNLRETSSFFIKGAVTHSALYLGNKELIHAVGDGVQYVSLHHIFTEYDTMVVLRLPHQIKGRSNIIRDAIKYAKTQLGKPYDFEFSKGIDKIFCTELINESFKHAGHNTHLRVVSRAKSFEEKIMKFISTASLALRPEQFLESNFDVIFISHNLKLKRKVVLRL
jgi:hypothetical protein